MIRRAVAEDLDDVVATFERSFGTLTFLPTLHTHEENHAFLARQLAEHDLSVFEDDAGAILGFTVVSSDRLEHLYVEPDAIGTGVGAALFADVTSQRPQGFDFWVFQQNERARRFYERRGCIAVEFTDGEGNEERTPDVRYEWRPTSR